MSKYSYGELREHKYSETEFSNTLYNVYIHYEKAAPLPYDPIASNCSYPIVNHYDKDDSKFTISCLPVEFINTKLLGYKANEFNKKTAVALLVKKIDSSKLTDLLAWMTNNNMKESHMRFVEACFKPYNSSITEPLPDFSSLEKDKLNKSHRKYWISNRFIRKNILPYCKVNNAKYMGTIYLNFLNNIKPDKRIDAFNNSAVKSEVIDMIKGSDKHLFVGYISLFDHWSTIVINTKSKTAYHYNSQGYIPTSQIKPPLQLYSYDRILRPCDYMPEDVGGSEQSMMIYFLRYLSKSIGLNKLHLNFEQSQQQDGECGVFSLLFSKLLFTHMDRPDIVPYVYNVYKFLGDKRMREFRDMMTTSKDTIYTDESNQVYKKYNKDTVDQLTQLIKRIKH